MHMKYIATGLLTTAALAIATPVLAQSAADQSTHSAVQSEIRGTRDALQRKHRATTGRHVTHRNAKGRGAYAYSPRHRSGHGSATATDPVKRSMDDPRAYGKPNRH